VVDSRLETPATARILQPPGRVLLAHAEGLAEPDALRATGCEFLPVPAPSGKTDLNSLLGALAGRGINELHVEAGHKLNGSWLRSGLVDELLVYVAPRLLGEGAGLAALGPYDDLADGPAFEFSDTTMIGPDVRLRARRTQALDALRAAMPLA
jgi:diaminohydroxyphosphoribosylaminopyrimidine deaminase / 5-amino-6-(5-phosphoribosylamino)uracil reductase